MNRFLRTFRDAPPAARTAPMDEVVYFLALEDLDLRAVQFTKNASSFALNR
jgi:hypothetical protein